MNIEQIEKLNAERTQGEWECREIGNYREHRVVTLIAGKEKSWICCNTTSYPTAVDSDDQKFIAAATTITEQYIKARRFEVSEEFLSKVYKEERRALLEKSEDSTVGDRMSFFKAMLRVMWTEIEGGDAPDINVGDIAEKEC